MASEEVDYVRLLEDIVYGPREEHCRSGAERIEECVCALSRLIERVYDVGVGITSVTARDLHSDICESLKKLGSATDDTDAISRVMRQRAVLLVAMYYEPEVGDLFATHCPKLVTDLRTRILPHVMRSFMSDMCQTPDAFCNTVAQLASMWPGEPLGNGAFMEPWKESDTADVDINQLDSTSAEALAMIEEEEGMKSMDHQHQ